MLVFACAFLFFLFVCLFVYNAGSDFYLQVSLSFNRIFNMTRLQLKKGLDRVDIKSLYFSWVEYSALW